MRLWLALEALPSGEAVTAAWRRELGSEFEAARRFLRPTGELARSYPCPARPPCGCEHRVVSHASGRIVAVCQCADGAGCERVVLEPKDVVIMAMDLRRLGVEVARALKFSPAGSCERDGAARAERIGSEGPLHSPVYLLVAADPADALQRVSALMQAESEPFFLLTPGNGCVTSEIRAALARHGCVHAGLGGLVELQADGRITAVGSMDGLRAEFGRRLTEGRGLVKAVERLDRNLEAVAKDRYELKQEVNELRQFQADGFFKFALRVDGDDFRAFAVIMALGNRKAAADFLKVPHRSFYDRVEKWSGRGREYQTLVRWMEWRKRSGRRIKLRLDDSIQSGEPNDAPENPETVGDVLHAIKADDSRDYPAILRQVMEALKAQNPKNWAAVRDELVEMIKEEVPQ